MNYNFREVLIEMPRLDKWTIFPKTQNIDRKTKKTYKPLI